MRAVVVFILFTVYSDYKEQSPEHTRNLKNELMSKWTYLLTRSEQISLRDPAVNCVGCLILKQTTAKTKQNRKGTAR